MTTEILAALLCAAAPLALFLTGKAIVWLRARFPRPPKVISWQYIGDGWYRQTTADGVRFTNEVSEK